MTRQQFRLLVVINQLLLFGGFIVADLTDPLLPPELQSYPSQGSSVFGEDLSETWLDASWYVINFATLVGAVGLCLGRNWGRTLYLASFVLSVLTGLFWPFTVSTNWSGLVFALYGTTEGMILALVYFSHLKRMFEGAREEDEEDEGEDDDEDEET